VIPTVLTIAGSDPSGGAGIQADLKTFHQRKVYGMAAITLLTVQNTQGVQVVYVMKPFQVLRQIEAVLSDIPPQAIKIGALGNGEIIHAIARHLQNVKCPLVVDPVMISKHGAPLLNKDCVRIFKKKILPFTTLLTPNLYEAAALTGVPVHSLESMEKAARMIAQMGSQAVLVKGGHLKGNAVDLLFQAGRVKTFEAPHLRTRHTHGTGCAYSAAIAAELAKGKTVAEAVRIAKSFITQAIRTAPGLGKGMGPVNHWAEA
jgi:hydroxymethylpyrimidine/phosphomethylpyrimidine kinase